jgi:hypothetical protein
VILFVYGHIIRTLEHAQHLLLAEERKDEKKVACDDGLQVESALDARARDTRRSPVALSNQTSESIRPTVVPA